MLAKLYALITRGAGPGLAWWLRRRAARGKELAERLPERMGVSGYPRPAGPLVWIHGASVGEAVSVLPLIEALLARDPALHILVTTGTVTSARLMEKRLPARAYHQFIPLDHPGWVARFLDAHRPDLAVWVESELWPNLLGAIRARGIPAALINARLSARSARGWERAPGLARDMLSSFRLILAQSTGDAGRLQRFTDAARIEIPGNLKFAGPPLPADPTDLAALQAAIGDRPAWLLASSHPGEEALAAAAHQALARQMPDLLTVIVPRHPERGAALAEELTALGLTVARRGAGALPRADTAIYLADTLGELGLFYRTVPRVVMGGSLVPHGGQNPIEPAKLGCALLSGPHMHNFRAVAGSLAAAGALDMIQPEGLAPALTVLLTDPAAFTARAAAARAVVAAEDGVLDRVISRLDPLLQLALKSAS